MKGKCLIVLSACLFMGHAAAGDNLRAGRDAYNTGEYEKAYDLFSVAFREDPANVEVNLALGDAAIKRKKFSHAVLAYDRVLMADPKNEKALLGKATALLALGQMEEARDAYNTVLNQTKEPAVRDSAQKSIQQIDQDSRELVVNGRAHLAGIYDDNVSYGNDDYFSTSPRLSEETLGLEGGVDLRTEYDVGRKDDWMLVGGMSLFDSWYDTVQNKEVANARIHAGLRNTGTRNLVEVVGRSERFWFGSNPLVDIYGGDAAWMFAASKNLYWIARLTMESRDYDSNVDPNGDRKSVYLQTGEEWKYFFSNRNNNLSIGVDLFSENAKKDQFTYLGYRVRVNGQMELPCGIMTYTGGRYRFAKYDDPSGFSTIDHEDDRWDLLVGAKRQLANGLWLDLSYLHVWNTSTQPDFEFDRNRVSLSAIYEF